MFYNMVGFELPKDTARKSEISGTVDSGIAGQRRIIVLNRSTFLVVGSTKVNDDGSWKVQLNTTGTNDLIAICVDDSANFNSDSFDRLSACSITHSVVPQDWASWFVLTRFKKYRLYPKVQPLNTPEISYQIKQKDCKGTITRFVIDTNFSKGHFVDSLGDPVTIGPGGTNTAVCVGSRINGLFKIERILNNGLGNNSVIVSGIPAAFYGGNVPLDFFSDGTAVLHLPLTKHNLKANGTAHETFMADSMDSAPVLGFPEAPFFENTVVNPKAFYTNFTMTQNGNYTFSFWIHSRIAQPDTVLFQNGTIKIAFSPSHTRLYIWVNTSGGTNLTTIDTVGATLLTAYVWNHYVISIGSSGLRVFKNGAQVHSNAVNYTVTPYTGTLDAFKGSLCIGGNMLQKVDQLNNTIVYNLRIFRRQVTTTGEALSLMNENIIVNGGSFDVNSISNFASKYYFEKLRKNSINNLFETVLISSEKEFPTMNSLSIIYDNIHGDRKYQKVIYSGNVFRKGECQSNYVPWPSSMYYVDILSGLHEIDTTGCTVSYQLGDQPQPGRDLNTSFHIFFTNVRTISGIALKSRLSSSDTYKNGIRSIRIHGSFSGDFTKDCVLLSVYEFNAQTFSGQWSNWLNFPEVHNVKALRFTPIFKQVLTTGNAWGVGDIAFKIDEEVPPNALSGRSIVIDIASNWGGTNMGIKHFSPKLNNKALFVDDWDFYSTSEESSSYTFKNACGLRQKNGPALNFSWKSSAGATTNQRLILVSPDTFYMDDFDLVNFHDNLTSLLTTGVRGVKISLSGDVITDTTYGQPISNSKLLYSGDVQQFVDITSANERFCLHIQNKKSIEARSVIFDISDGWGNASYVGIKRIEFFLRGEIIPYAGDWTCAATSFNAGFPAVDTFNTALTISETSPWLAAPGSNTNQRILVQFPSIKEFDEIKIVNWGTGGSTDYGSKNVTLKITLNSVLPSTVYNSAITGSVTVGSYKFGINSCDYLRFDGRFSLPLLSKDDKKVIKARSVVIDLDANYGGADLAFGHIWFTFMDKHLEPENSWAFYFSDKDATVIPKNVFSIGLGVYEYDGHVSTTNRCFYKTGKSGKIRLIVVFPSIMEFDKILFSLWRAYSPEKNQLRYLRIYTTENVLDNSHCVWNQSVPNTTLIKDAYVAKHLFNVSVTNNRVAYTTLLDNEYNGGNQHIVLLLQSNAPSSNIFTDTSMYENVFSLVGAPIHTDQQYYFGTSSLDFRSGHLTCSKLGLYSLSNITFKIRCFVYSMSLSTNTAILSKWKTSDNTRSYRLSIVNGYLEFAYSTDGTNEIVITSNTQIPINTWTYIEVVRMWETLVLKIGNSIDRSYTIGLTKISPSYAPVCIGTQDDDSLYRFNGFIDELEFSIGSIFDISTSVPMTGFQNVYSAFPKDNSSIFGSISFDSGNTYKVFYSASWRSIASCDPIIHGNVGDTDWYYLNGSDSWSKSGISNDPYSAISKAVELNTLNRNTLTNLSSYTNEYDLEFDKYIDLALTCTREGSSYPIINDISVNGKKYWYSDPVSLEDLISPSVTTTNFAWQTTNLLPPNVTADDEEYTTFNNSIKVYYKKTGDLTWQECTNNQPLIGLPNGTLTAGVLLYFMVEYMDSTKSNLALFTPMLELSVI